MTLVPNETEQALNRQYDVYAAAREEYRKKIEELAAENEWLRAALEDCIEILDDLKWNTGAVERARAALEGKHERDGRTLHGPHGRAGEDE